MRVHNIVPVVLFLATTACGQSSSPVVPTPASCSFTVMPTLLAVPAEGGRFKATTVMTGACPWTATTEAPWIVITSGSPATATGTFTYFVQSNRDGLREGTVTVQSDGGASVSVTIIQAGVDTVDTVQ